MTYAQTRAVARKLAQLDRFEKELRELTAAYAKSLNKALAMEQQQPCGHEARFIVGSDEGTNWCALCALEDAHKENQRLRCNLAMHETPVLAVWKEQKASQEAIALLEKSGLDVRVAEVGVDTTGEGMMTPYLICECPGGSGIKRIRELVKRAVPFVHTGGHR